MVRGNGGHDSRLIQHAHRFECHILYLDLISAGKIRAHYGRKSLLRQLLCYHMPLRAMIQGHLQMKFLCDPDGSKDIVHPVHMGLQGNLPAKYRKPAFHPKVFLESVSVISSFFLLLRVSDRFCQFLSQHGGNCHPGGRAFTLSGIIDLGIFTKSCLHGCRGSDNQIIYPPSPGFQKGKLPAHHI